MSLRGVRDRLVLALGVYAGALTWVLLVSLTGRGVRDPVAAGGALVGALLVVGVGARAADLGVRLAGSRASLAFVAVPAVGGVVLGLLLTTGRDVGGAGRLVVLVGVLSLVPGGVVYVVADNRRVARVRERATPAAEWASRPPARRVRRAKLLAASLGLALFGGSFAASLVADLEPAFPASIGGSLAGVAFTFGRNGHYGVYPQGLVVDPPGALHGTVVPWSRFTGYSRTGDRIVLHRRLPGRSIHCRLADVRDPDAVTAALDTYLDRQE